MEHAIHDTLCWAHRCRPLRPLRTRTSQLTGLPSIRALYRHNRAPLPQAPAGFLFQDFKTYHFNKKKIDVNQIMILYKEEFASIEPDIKSEMEKLVLLSHLKI